MENESVTCGYCCKNFFRCHWRGLFTVVVPIVLSPIMFCNKGNEFRCLWLICVMALYWITEVIPLYVTSLIPIVALPVMGILDTDTTCRQYFQNPLAMFLGGLMIATAIEYCNLHKRVALAVILTVGCSPRRLHFGLVVVAGFISMWISNSATVAMMCPIIRAVLDELQAEKILDIYMSEDEETSNTGEGKHLSKIAQAYYFGVAYGATIGGCGTLIGTATNLTFKGIYESRFPTATEHISFLLFMGYCMPLVIVNIIIMFLGLQITNMGLWRPNSKEGLLISATKEGTSVATEVVQQKYKELGSLTMHEFQVIVLFLLMIILLITLEPGFAPGWADFFNAKVIKSSMPIMLVVVMLFLFPMNYVACKWCGRTGPYTKNQTLSLITWKYLNAHVPWGLVFLLGGGYALAAGIHSSGTAKMISESLKGLKSLPQPVLQFSSAFVGILFTAFSSNVAICNIIVPILCELAIVVKIHPLLLVYPAGLGCSFAFHLPVSTPPNAIIAGYANIRTKYMAVAGIIPTIAGLLTIFLTSMTWHYLIYPNSGFPDWGTPAQPSTKAPVV